MSVRVSYHVSSGLGFVGVVFEVVKVEATLVVEETRTRALSTKRLSFCHTKSVLTISLLVWP